MGSYIWAPGTEFLAQNTCLLREIEKTPVDSSGYSREFPERSFYEQFSVSPEPLGSTLGADNQFPLEGQK